MFLLVAYKWKHKLYNVLAKMLPMEIMIIVILILSISIYPVMNLMIGLELGEIKSYHIYC